MDRTYPQGVTCWVDTEQPDPDAAATFYGELFGWTFADAMPPEAPSRYLIAQSGGLDAAAIGEAPGAAARWNTYVAVDDVDEMTRRLAEAGAEVVSAPAEAGPGGRTSTLRSGGLETRLWQARQRLGAQVLNQPAAWNFSDLHTDDEATRDLLADAFGWRLVDQGWATAIQVPGYGDHLEATVDPDIRTRQAHAPEGFEDVIGGVRPLAEGERPHWHVTFTVADRDATVATAGRLGATVLGTDENAWTRTAVLRDPQGAVFTASQFAPKGW